VLIKGPVGLMVVALSVVALWAWDRKAPWLKDLGWGWGLTLFAGHRPALGDDDHRGHRRRLLVDGVAGDLAPKLAGGQESHGAGRSATRPGAPLLVFPATLLLPAALAQGWTGRKEPGVRFALCWLIPTWLVFEILPTKLAHYTLPAMGGPGHADGRRRARATGQSGLAASARACRPWPAAAGRRGGLSGMKSRPRRPDRPARRS
jgi:hypothetical protein